MKKGIYSRLKVWGLILLFFTGLGIVVYPKASSLWNQRRADQLVAVYSKEARDEEDLQGDYLEKAVQYNETLTGGKVPDAFAVRENKRDREYEALLNVGGNDMIGYIEIPAIDVNIPIYHYTTEEVLKKGAGHLFGSSLPVGGESVHSVISAHRGLPEARLFTDLNLLEEGDVFYITVLTEKLAYEVDRIQVVEPDETESLGIEPGKDYVTLVTCTPYAVNTHRLLVRGKRTDYTEAAYEEQKAKTGLRNAPAVLPNVLCALAGIGIAVLFVKVLPVGKRDKK